MFGWLKKRVLDASADAMKNDIMRFTAGLEGADPEEISTMLVIANVLRLRLTENGVIPPAALNFSIPRDDDLSFQCDKCSIELLKYIKEFQKIGQPTDAAGVMIWLHSVRALNVPENRIYGRRMWQELERGFPFVEDTLFAMREMVGSRIPHGISENLKFVPRGLEPQI